MKVIRSLACAALLLAAGTRTSPAWNGTGHEVIADIAWRELTPETKAKISAILRATPDYDALLTTPSTAPDQRDREAFLKAATWPDLVRTPGRNFRFNHPAWHYIDYPYVLGEVPPVEGPVTQWKPGTDPANAAQAFQKAVGEFQDEKLPDVDRAIALCWIEHLTGDIHQPLHAVSMFTPELPHGDQGGNLLMVTADSSVTNLHALWDGLLGKYEATEAIDKIADKVAAAHGRSEFSEALKVRDFDAWARGSFEEARTAVYLEGKLLYLKRDDQQKDRTRPVPEVPADYMANSRAHAERDVALAAYRLADLLNEMAGASGNARGEGKPGAAPR
jgi:hypothetical protein